MPVGVRGECARRRNFTPLCLPIYRKAVGGPSTIVNVYITFVQPNRLVVLRVGSNPSVNLSCESFVLVVSNSFQNWANTTRIVGDVG